MEKTEHLNDTTTISGMPYHCILFNDEGHNMDEVINQIKKATGYDYQKSYQIMMQAHIAGRAIVVTGSQERCGQVSSVLEEIRLGTKVEPAA
jgi:ATP-dependent Clp protease adapter protein ClpS